jgi:ATP-dependent Clp protease protease subunit
MYINSPGTSLGNQIAAFETEAFAIADTMNYVTAETSTICVGTAFGTAAMILASGGKGRRAALPNASMMLRQPIGQARGQASDIAIKAKEVLNSRYVVNKMIADKTGQPIERVEEDSSRNKYLDAQAAKEYGLIDQILTAKELPAEPKFFTSL